MPGATQNVLAAMRNVASFVADKYMPRERPRLVAFTGPAGAGKSTAAQHLVDKHGFVRVRFAGPLKDMMRAIGLGEAEIEGALKERPSVLLGGKTPRHAMQTLGTEWGRECIGPDFWTGLWGRIARDVMNEGGRVVVDDCRFENEAEVVRSFGGVIVRLTGRGGISGAHVSEAGCSFDREVANDNEPADLYTTIDRLVA